MSYEPEKKRIGVMGAGVVVGCSLLWGASARARRHLERTRCKPVGRSPPTGPHGSPDWPAGGSAGSNDGREDEGRTQSRPTKTLGE